MRKSNENNTETFSNIREIKDYILNKYSVLRPNNFEIIKISNKLYIIVADKNNPGTLIRKKLLNASITAINMVPIFHDVIWSNVRAALKQAGHL